MAQAVRPRLFCLPHAADLFGMLATLRRAGAGLGLVVVDRGWPVTFSP